MDFNVTKSQGTVRLEGMKFRSFHGCLERERIEGNDFIVDLEFSYDMSRAAVSDSLEDALDYSSIYAIVAGEMSIPSNLLENVAFRIRKAILSDFPGISSLNVTVSKLDPPLPGEVHASSVTL